MDAHAEFSRALDDRLGFHVGLARVNVEHVVGRGAAGQQHFRHRNLRAELDSLEIEPAPDFVQAAQPVEQFRILDRFQAPRQRLI